MKTVSVVVTTHQGRRFLPRCLDALEASRVPAGWSLEVLVSDNGSTDGTASLLAQRYPWAKAIISEKPLGFSGANNAAREVATGEVVVFLNNDTQVDPGWLERPLAILEQDPRIGGVGSRLVYMHRFQPWKLVGPQGHKLAISTTFFGSELDQKVRWSPGVPGPEKMRGGDGRWLSPGDSFYLPDPLDGLDVKAARPAGITVLARLGAGELSFVSGEQRYTPGARLPWALVPEASATRVDVIQNAGGNLTVDGEGGDYGAGSEAEQSCRDEEIVPSLCGAAFFARKADLDAVGWFPSGYVVYYEDVHLSLKLRQLGRDLVYCPGSTVRHYHTGTNREFSPFFIENVVRSRLSFTAAFARGGVLTRSLGRQAAFGARELLHGTATTPLAAWRQSPGLRGVVKSLPRVMRLGMGSTLARQLKGEPAPLETLSLNRLAYRFDRSHKGP